MTVIFRNSLKIRALRIENTFQTPACIDQRYCQFRTHLQFGVERIIYFGPWLLPEIRDKQRLAGTGNMCHDAVSIKRKLFHQWFFKLNTIHCASNQKLATFVEQAKNTVLRIRYFQGQLQDRLKRFFQTQSGGDQHTCSAQAIEFFLFMSKVTPDPGQMTGVIDGHRSLIDKVIEHKLFEMSKLALFT